MSISGYMGKIVMIFPDGTRMTSKLGYPTEYTPSPQEKTVEELKVGDRVRIDPVAASPCMGRVGKLLATNDDSHDVVRRGLVQLDGYGAAWWFYWTHLQKVECGLKEMPKAKKGDRIVVTKNDARALHGRVGTVLETYTDESIRVALDFETQPRALRQDEVALLPLQQEPPVPCAPGTEGKRFKEGDRVRLKNGHEGFLLGRFESPPRLWRVKLLSGGIHDCAEDEMEKVSVPAFKPGDRIRVKKGVYPQLSGWDHVEGVIAESSAQRDWTDGSRIYVRFPKGTPRPNGSELVHFPVENLEIVPAQSKPHPSERFKPGDKVRGEGTTGPWTVKRWVEDTTTNAPEGRWVLVREGGYAECSFLNWQVSPWAENKPHVPISIDTPVTWNNKVWLVNSQRLSPDCRVIAYGLKRGNPGREEYAEALVSAHPPVPLKLGGDVEVDDPAKTPVAPPKEDFEAGLQRYIRGTLASKGIDKAKEKAVLLRDLAELRGFLAALLDGKQCLPNVAILLARAYDYVQEH